MDDEKRLKGRTRMRNWRLKNPERARASAKRNYNTNIDKRRDIWFRCQYGITLITYNEMLAKQNHKCLICFIDETNLKKKLAVDHDHKTGKVRGLLCVPCNRVLGVFKDDIERLQRAMDYLKIHDN